MARVGGGVGTLKGHRRHSNNQERGEKMRGEWLNNSWKGHGTGLRTRVGGGVRETWKVWIPANKGRGWKTRDWGSDKGGVKKLGTAQTQKRTGGGGRNNRQGGGSEK